MTCCEKGAEMAEITVGDAVFNVSVEGLPDAPVVLLAHSLGADLTQWDPQVEALASRFRVVRYDSRGHGMSEAGEEPISIARLGADALGLLDALDIEKAHVVGLSLGGQVALWLAINAPARVGRIALANTSACFGHPDIWNARIRQALAEGMDSLAEMTMDRWFTREFQEREPMIVDRVAARFRATPTQAYAATVAALRDSDLREAARSVTSQTLVIVGEQDPAATPAAGAFLAQNIQRARLVALDAAHLSNIEAAEAFTNAIIDFLTAPDASVRIAKKTARKTAKKTAAKKTVAKKAAKKAAVKKTAAKKAAKKAAKTSASRARAASAAGKTVKKAAKKTAKKTAKKATKTVARKAAKKAAKKLGKKPANKVAKKTAKKTVKTAARGARKAVKASIAKSGRKIARSKGGKASGARKTTAKGRR